MTATFLLIMGAYAVAGVVQLAVLFGCFRDGGR